MSLKTNIEDLIGFGGELAREVTVLLASGTPRPCWDDKQAAWRHDTATQDAILYLLTKLSGSVSSTNAMLRLSERGFWFESAILARSIYDACLSILYILPGPSTDWPTVKQKAALVEFFKETWENPERPFEEPRLRSQIPIKDLKNGLEKFQTASSEINPHDANQTALQMMRFLSDYTHMAYPRLMELLQAGRGYQLNGEQPQSSAFGLDGVAGALCHCVDTADNVATFLVRVFSVMADYSLTQGNAGATNCLKTRADAITAAHAALSSLHGRVASATFSTDASAQRVLMGFKGKLPGSD